MAGTGTGKGLKRAMKIKARDILFEITIRCNKSCAYCGSKTAARGAELTSQQRLDVCDRIVKLAPESVTFTGGEPTLVLEDLLACAKKLKSSGIRVGVVTNGMAGLDLLWDSEYIDTIGLSINDPGDIARLKQLLDVGLRRELGPGGKITVVTNFGTHNIFDFQPISDFVRANCGFWQIQLTMGEFLLPPSGIAHLYEQIKSMPTGEFGYVLSDNLQPEHSCEAGLSAMSIDYQGNVLSCLSKRSWDPEYRIEANIRAVDDVERFWRQAFEEERFGTCACCRDRVKYPDLPEERLPAVAKPRRSKWTLADQLRDTPLEMPDRDGPVPTPMPSPWSKPGTIMMYAVVTPLETPYPRPWSYEPYTYVCEGSEVTL